jgi:hypothetical protein
MFAIWVRLSPDLVARTGAGGGHYTFPTRRAARAFIAGHWMMFGAEWKARNLKIEPDPPCDRTPTRYGQ